MGFSWNKTVRNELQNDQQPFDIKACELPLIFVFDGECNTCFTRTITQPLAKSDAEFHVVDFAVLTLPDGLFQTEEISMVFETVDFNLFASPQNEKVLLLH